MQIASDSFFTYDGHQSYLYGLRFAWIEESPETNVVSEKSYSQIKDSTQNLFRVAKSGFEDALSFDTEIASDRVLFDQEVRRIYNKFFDKNEYRELMLPAKNGEHIYLNCIFTNVEKIEGGLGDRYGVVGFKAKILCDAPWGWTEEYHTRFAEQYTKGRAYSTGDVVYENGKGYVCNASITYSNSLDEQYNGSPRWSVVLDELNNYAVFAPIETTVDNNGITRNKIRIFNRSDSQEYIYPEVLITIPAKNRMRVTEGKQTRIGNEYSCLGCPKYKECIHNNSIPPKAMIINTSDDKTRGTCILCEGDGQSITMEPKIGTITGVKSGGTAVEPKLSYTNKKFIRLLPGENIFELENVIDIDFKFREARILV